jgi:hypothetical protein
MFIYNSYLFNCFYALLQFNAKFIDKQIVECLKVKIVTNY